MIYGAMLFLKFTCVYCLSMLFSYVYLFIKDVDYSYCNPSTGPVYFNDVKPGDHGGNMDTTMIKEGATVFLPVFAEGGLMAVGDFHAAMGDGESFYMGLETEGYVELEVNVRHDMKIDIPFVVADGRLASIATEADAIAALKKAICDFVNMLADLKGDISMQLSEKVNAMKHSPIRRFNVYTGHIDIIAQVNCKLRPHMIKSVI